VIATKDSRQEILKSLELNLERYRYPIRELEVHAFGEDEVEIEAKLTVTSVDGEEMDALVRELATLPGVRQAFWSPSTTE
ncbi:MAG: MgtC/SapB family protein, partial [Thermodesulfovibrionales bacterium]